MKKKTLLLASALFAGTAFAQDLTSKKGETIMPEAGDWAISFDAVPFLNYFGQMLSNAGASSPALRYTNGYPWAIKGKMFKDEKTAYRAGIRLAFGNKKWANEIAAPQASTSPAIVYPNTAPVVEDTYKWGYNSIVLTGGLEMRRGKTRLQGYYGGEVLIGFGGMKDTWEYGNALSAGTAPDPFVDVTNSTDWNAQFGTATNFTTDPTGTPARLLESKTSMMMIGLRGFIGVEYFILPKISIGAEYGWGFGMTSTKTTQSMESNEIPATGTAYVVGTFDTETKSSGMSIDSDIQGMSNGNMTPGNVTGILGGSGSLNIIFHF